MESWVQSWRPRTNAFCDFSSPPVEGIAPATKKWCQVIRSAAPVTQNHHSKPEDLMLQNATPRRKSPPSPPNSDEDVSCIAPATENVSLQILFTCPTPAILFGNATKPSCFLTCHFWQSAQSLAPATQNDIWTSKSGAYMWCFVHFDFVNGVQFFISHLASWLRTHRFSEPTFRPSGATNHWKNSVSRLSYLFAHLHLLSSDSFSSLIFSLLLFSSLWLFPSLLFICPDCRKFDF